MKYLYLVLISASFLACGTIPKPQELTSLEQMRQGDRFELAQKKQAELMQESESAHKKAIEAWEDEDLELAKHWATIAAIKQRTALAMIDQQETKRRIEKVQATLKKTQEERKELEAKNKDADEKLQLYSALATAKKSAKEKDAKLSEAQQREVAQKKVSEANLAIKKAETVEAEKYAKELYTLAQSMVMQAENGIKTGNFSAASSAAELARTKAEAAYQAARPEYQSAQKTASRHAQNLALQRDAAAINGVTVKLKTVGQTQQLVIPVLNLFKRKNTSPRADKRGILNAIGELLKKYPAYPVMINGYTSFRVARSQQYAVSLARAQQIANHFIAMGLPLKRFVINGQGGENLIARRYSTLNDRVEIILLFE